MSSPLVEGFVADLTCDLIRTCLKAHNRSVISYVIVKVTSTFALFSKIGEFEFVLFLDNPLIEKLVVLEVLGGFFIGLIFLLYSEDAELVSLALILVFSQYFEYSTCEVVLRLSGVFNSQKVNSSFWVPCYYIILWRRSKPDSQCDLLSFVG